MNAFNIKFTKASRKDNKKVTVRVNELLSGRFVSPNFRKHFNTRGNLVIINVEGIPTVWKVNRPGETLSTDAFPGKLRLPNVGRPVTYSVTEISPILPF